VVNRLRQLAGTNQAYPRECLHNGYTMWIILIQKLKHTPYKIGNMDKQCGIKTQKGGPTNSNQGIIVLTWCA